MRAESAPEADGVRVPRLSVGILTADLSRLREELGMLRGHDVWAHVDVMDGRFCPALTAGPPLLKAVATCGTPVDAHLMVEEPRRFLGDVVAAGVAAVTVHAESTKHLHGALQELAALRADQPTLVRGLALNPGTPIAAVEPVIELIDMVLLVAVTPGARGHSPAANTARRIGQVRDLAAAMGRVLRVGVDGGITRHNIATVASWRPDLVVSGSAIYDGQAAEANLVGMLAALEEVQP